VAGGVALWGTAEIVGRVAGAQPRFTGSLQIPVSAPPVTTFFGEPTPDIDPDRWRLNVTGRVRPVSPLTLADLANFPSRDVRATLDCTSGWSADCVWRGVPLQSILAAAIPEPGASVVQVTSVTGWSAVLPLPIAADVLLATHVGGTPLAAGNGAPVRLVAPDRRGLEWVKWVDRIEVR
jgi:DMSO/TMAO reductase YedYZ molybdopterin-dependent catalytic subunit